MQSLIPYFSHLSQGLLEESIFRYWRGSNVEYLLLEHLLQAFWQWVHATLTCVRFFRGSPSESTELDGWNDEEEEGGARSVSGSVYG